MPINERYQEPFCENKFLHVTCKAISNVSLFRNDENRLYFLNKYAQYSRGYFETYSYVLLDNHVHWLIKTVDNESLVRYINTIPHRDRKLHQRRFIGNEISFEQACDFQFKDFFISYAMAYNRRFERSGALFLNPFRRVNVEDEQHFIQVIVYHHANVVKHGLRKDFESYQWSSYRTMLSVKPTILQRNKVLEWFGGREEFVRIHQEMTAYYYSAPLDIE